MHVLFRKLDSLTHLHYTPKQKSAELKIVRNIPTINMEEVAPVAASNATLLGKFWISPFFLKLSLTCQFCCSSC